MKPTLKKVSRGMLAALVLGAMIAAMMALDYEFFYDWLLRSVSFVEVENQRTKLINGLESYQSIDEARSWFAAQSIKWKVVEDQHLAPGDKRPPYNYYSISIEKYLHLGCSGRLTVTFFNNRLANARFYPTDYDKYLDSLAQQEGVHFTTNPRIKESQEATIPPYTRVRLGHTYEDPCCKLVKYVEWVDTRLQKELMIWTIRYS